MRKYEDGEIKALPFDLTRKGANFAEQPHISNKPKTNKQPNYASK